jgi:VIT1/CCC1 family predicted Fe2+/Mn2+ transporter
MAILIAPFIALFIVVLSACVMGLALFVVAALSGSFGGEKKIEREGPRPLPRQRRRPSSR